jgi:hypothetical protein
MLLILMLKYSQYKFGKYWEYFVNKMLKFVKGKLYSNFLLKILKNYHNKNFQPEKIIVTIIVIILKKGVFLKLFSGFHFWTFLKCPFFIFLFTFWNFFSAIARLRNIG